MDKKTIKLHANVHKDPKMPGRVGWRVRSISVPVCRSCSGKLGVITNLESYAQNYAIVKQEIDQGWKIGERPSQKEMDEVEFL